MNLIFSERTLLSRLRKEPQTVAALATELNMSERRCWEILKKLRGLGKVKRVKLNHGNYGYQLP